MIDDGIHLPQAQFMHLSYISNLHVLIQAADARRAHAACELSGPAGEGEWRAVHARLAARRHRMLLELAQAYEVRATPAPKQYGQAV